jgi:hypothetical protein
MEASDKIILPPSAFKEINRLKLPFPLTFRVTNERMKTANTVRGIEGERNGPRQGLCLPRNAPHVRARMPPYGSVRLGRTSHLPARARLCAHRLYANRAQNSLPPSPIPLSPSAGPRQGRQDARRAP